MENKQGSISLNATDLVHHHDCHHLTNLERSVALGLLERPKSWSPLAALLAERGDAHERAFVSHLADSGLELARIDGRGIDAEAATRTVDEMQRGTPVIVQGALRNGRWGGRIDVLRRVEIPSRFGAWFYEAIDAKLSRLTKGNTLLQLSLYSELVEQVQGVTPEHMGVVTPWSDFRPEQYRVNAFAAYFRLIKARLLSAVDGPTGDTYPEPNLHCALCSWLSRCDSQRRSDDHLCFVAGISKLQIKELAGQGIHTTAALAVMPLPLAWKPSRGAVEPYERIREQARLQVQARTTGQPAYELLPREPGLGLARLPPPDPGDIFFDLEGDPFVDLGGREYLFGYLFLDESGRETYRADWSLTRSDERRAFEAFIDFVMERWSRHPNLHIYHFAPYEPSALRRLMGRYASRENEVDRLLRGKTFVDLYPITKQAVRASVESYSIKKLEPFCGFMRTVDLDDAGRHLALIQSNLELGEVGEFPEESLTAVAGYNRDDCASALALRDWLEGLRARLIADGEQIERPPTQDDAPSERVSARQQAVRVLMTQLLKDVPVDKEARDIQQQALWTLAHVLDWHRREDKVVWWEYFRLCDLDADELLNERAALSGLSFAGRVTPGKAPVDRYNFPVQETQIRGDEDLWVLGGDKLGKVAAISFEDRTVDIKKMKATADLHPQAVFAFTRIDSGVLADSLLRIGQSVADQGLNGDSPYLAACDLIARRPPRLGDAPIQTPDESALEAARRIARILDGGVFPIQGPPGSGKTYIGARMICEFVRMGKKVGVTATSHKVIRLLLEEVVAASKEEGLQVNCAQKIRPDDPVPSGIAPYTSNRDLLAAMGAGTQVAGATAWLWADPNSLDAVDVLVVDEAAQMSLANVLAVSPAARTLVLLGDPNQLEQPQQASHPDGTGVSALDYVLAGAQTMPPDRGLFVGETWRLHPSICAFTSEQFYEGRLHSRPGLELQEIGGNHPLGGSGLRYIPVEHDGNQSYSVEEAVCVDGLVRSLLASECWWMDRAAVQRPLQLDDILVIAPYNAQVFELQHRLPAGARVGTVDKFQGQEAPLVIYSMATSNPEDAPHGTEFLHSANRLNVATSRAKCMCVIVATPRIFTPDCRTPRQMQLANAYCRYLELAATVAV